MGEQEMEFADPDWKPSGSRHIQQDNVAAYASQPRHTRVYDTDQDADDTSYAQGYREQLHREQISPYAPPYSRQMLPYPARAARGRSRWWLWVIILIIVLSLFGGVFHSDTRQAAYPRPFPGGPDSAQQTYSYDLGSASLVHISDFSGSIILQVGDTNSNQVEVQTDAANSEPPQKSVDGSTMTITVNPSQGSSDVVVMLPPQVAVYMETSAGNIEVDGYTGQVSAKTESGSIVLNASTLIGQCAISSDLGNIYMGQGSVTGVTDLDTNDGSITLDQEALSGQLMANVRGSGDISFNGTLNPKGPYYFTTNKGNIDLTLPADTSMRVQTSLGPGGTYYSEFPPITGQSPQAFLYLKTTGGGIHIHEQHS